MEPIEGVSVVHTDQLLTKMFQEQNISFVKVITISSILYHVQSLYLGSVKATATNASVWQKIQIISTHRSFIRIGY